MAAKRNNLFTSKARLAFNPQEAQQHDYIFFNNPVLVQGYAMACALGGAVNLQAAVVLALAGSLLIFPVRLIGEASVGFVKARLRMLVYIIAAALISIAMLALVLHIFGAEAVLLGLYLPLLFADMVVTSRAAQPMREGWGLALRGALSTVVGFSLALVLIGGTRELLSFGTLWDVSVVPAGIWPAAQTVPGALVVTALYAALWQYVSGGVKKLLFIGGREDD